MRLIWWPQGVQMRTIAALICLIFVGAIVSGQDTPEPSPYPVHPLCDMAFSAAAAEASGGGEVGWS